MKFTEYITEISKFQAEQFGVIKTIEKLAQPFIKEFRNTGSKKLIWRGSKRPIAKSLVNIKPRTDRSPKDMPQDMHDDLDFEFNRKFGWRARSEGVFATSNKITAQAYGNDIGIMIPVGKYKYLYNPDIKDLFTEIGDNPDMDIENYIEMWADDYDAEFGTDSGNGSWYYEGVDTGESDFHEATIAAAEAEGVDVEEMEGSDLEWIGEVSEEDYMAQKEREFEEEENNNIPDVVAHYKSTNLKKALNTGVEIMVKPESSYLLIDKKFEKYVLEYLKTGKYPWDLKQMELQFERDPKFRSNVASSTGFKYNKSAGKWLPHSPETKLKMKMKQKIYKTTFSNQWGKEHQQPLPLKKG